MARDDFTKKTKTLAALRVAYRCSFKNCGIPTVGPNHDDISGTTNIGVACHICAASSRGPRYNSAMTPAARKSIENCIWMCQSHSKLIDSEPAKYTVEILRRWKEEAEQNAAEAISNFKITKSELEDPQRLIFIFDALIRDGNYDVLKCILEQGSHLNDHDELLLRYKIIYAIYCNRAEVLLRTREYIDHCNKSHIEELIKYFISFNVRDGIDSLVSNCQNEELRMFAETVLNNSIEGKFIGKKDDVGLMSIPESKCFIMLLSTYIIDRFHEPLQDAEGKAFNLYEGEFAFKMRKLAWQIICAGIRSEKYYSENSQNEDFIVLKTNFSKIRQLDVELQKIIWIACLNYSINHKDLFREVYSECPLFVQELHEIKRIVINFSQIHKLENNENLLNDCLKNNQEDFLYDILRLEPKEKQMLFLDEHRYLLKSDVELLSIWINLLPLEERYSTIQAYKEYYNNNFLWRCMDAYYAPEQITAQESLIWLTSNNIDIPYEAINFYVNVLKKYEQWDSLKKLLQYHLPNHFKYHVVLALSSIESIEIKKKCIEICIELDAVGFKTEGFYYNSAVLYHDIGDKENAKNYFEKEYIFYPKSEALIQLLQLRYQTKDFRKDDFFFAACKTNSFELQHLIAAINYESSNVTEAKFYILRSLLINSANFNALNAYFIWESEHPDDSFIANDKVYYLKNDNSIIKIALHDSRLLEDIMPQNFMDCIHLDYNDERILTWQFENKGNTVRFENQDYIIDEIKPFADELKAFVFSRVLTSDKTYKITGNSHEEAVENLRQQLLELHESKQQVIDMYNQLDGKFPLSIFSAYFGHGFCKTWGFILCENTKRLINNINYNPPEDSTFLLAIDSIQTLATLDVLNYIDVPKLACAPQTKPILLEEIIMNLQDIKSTSVGTLGVSNGKLSGVKYTPESKKYAISYWTKLKKFVEPIKELDGGIYICINQDVQKFFIEQDLTYESYLLGTMQKVKNTVLVTDDPFLSFVCEIEKIPYISAVNILLLCKFDFGTWISILDKLPNLNFSNYITPSIYKHLINLIANENDQEQKEKYISALENWLLPHDCDIDHHQMIFNLYRLLLLEDQKSPYASSLTRIALQHYSILNPKAYHTLIQSVYQQIQLDFAPDDSDKPE